jgi:hypothetical protein
MQVLQIKSLINRILQATDKTADRLGKVMKHTLKFFYYYYFVVLKTGDD